MENQTLISANRKEILESALFRARAEYVDPDNRKILGQSARTKILGYETFAGAVQITFKTSFRLIFQNDDGTFGHIAIETEQTETINDPAIQPTTFISLQAAVTDCNRQGKFSEATVCISGWYIVENSVALLNACQPDLQCKTGVFKAENVNKLLAGGLALTYTDESRMNIASLIDYCPEVTVTNVYPGSGSYRIEGDIYIRIFAQSEEGQCFNQLFTHTFSTEISDENITSSSDIDVDASIKNVDLSLADGDKRMLILDISLSFCGSYAETVETETVVDAYSITNDVIIKSEDVTVSDGFCLRALREKITAQITPTGGINELFGVLCPNISASFVTNNGSVSIEGVVEADILYANGKDKHVGMKTETPFKISLPIDYKCETKMQPQILVTAIGGKVRGGEVDLLIEMILTVKGVSQKSLRVATDVEMGAQKEENDFAISLYIVQKGETMWDVAKALNTSEETLTKQNADVPLPLTGGEKIILYRQLPF